jgi:serine/threonine-protein kinase
VAAFCYVCGTATPPGFDLMTGERVAVSRSGITATDLRKRVQRILGPGYELGERIGAGGFAEVFKARDLRLKRSVAVKVLRPDLGLTPGMLERFRREAEVIAALRHPNIVPIYDVGEGDGVAFIIMPFIEGESLRARMERDGAMSGAETQRILVEAARGLAAAHDAGVIHRDIKPENIMLEGRESRALLMDFGIAKAVDGHLDTPATDEGIAPALTSTGIIVGTPQYMSPEQACGDKTIDARTDQYSLAVVGYRMLSGALPFDGESTRAVLYKQLVAEATPLAEKVPDVPTALAAAIGRAMQKEPSDRFDDMSGLAEALDAASVDAPVTRVGPTPAPGARLSALAHPVAARLGALVSRLPPLQGRLASRRVQGLLAAGMVVVLVAVVFQLARSPGESPEDFQPSSAVDPLAASVPVEAGEATPTQPTGTTSRSIPPPAVAGRGSRPPPPASRASAPTLPPPGPPPGPTCTALVGANNWSAAAATCTTAAQSGDVIAMRHLAGMYDRGNGVPEDPAQAVSWYRRAAPNDGESAFQLSRLYEIGRGTPRDARANITALREAAAKGHLQAILTLSARLESGAGMNRDDEEAALWYRRAADAGSTAAMLKLGDWTRRGRGVTKDEAAGVEWYRKAADAGSSEGAWLAAQAYLGGRGVARDEAQGLALLRKAAGLGNAQAAEELRKREG